MFWLRTGLDLLTEEHVNQTQRFCRRLSSKFFEIVNHVHLVVIAELVGYVGPTTLWRNAPCSGGPPEIRQFLHTVWGACQSAR